MELVKTALPKSKGGRKAKELDSELLDALAKALKDAPMEGDRPSAYGPATDFDTEGKASGEARRYATALSDSLKKKVSVNAYPVNEPKDGAEATAPFRWRVYIPLAAQKNGK